MRSSTSRRKRCGGRNATRICRRRSGTSGERPRSTISYVPWNESRSGEAARTPWATAWAEIASWSRPRNGPPTITLPITAPATSAAATGIARRSGAPCLGAMVAARSRGGDCSSEATMWSTRSGTGSAGRIRTAVRTRAEPSRKARHTAQPSTCESTSIPRRPPTYSPSIRADSASCARSQFIVASHGRIPPPRHPIRTRPRRSPRTTLGGPGTCGSSPFPSRPRARRRLPDS